MNFVPYRIDTEHLILRCYNPVDAVLLQKSIQESTEHLRPWMPWINDEPEPLEKKIQRLRQFRAKFDLDQEYVYGIFDKKEQELIGGTGLHPRCGPDAIEIGYWINVNHIRKGYATEVAGALTKVAFEYLKVERVEIHCDPRNIASAKVPQKLGYQFDATLRNRMPDSKGILRDVMIWSILKKEYEQAPIKRVAIQAYDVMGANLNL
jgi:RimJ/RimL family protein N-acetyltransferase